MHIVALTLLCLSALVQAAESPRPAVEPGSESDRVEIYFEIKLLTRSRHLLQHVAVDQWAGGRLLMRARPVEASAGAGRVRLDLIRPLEDPWVFRWYDSKDEVKLGAAVWVPRPTGDPYHSLYEVLEPAARSRYGEWWSADRVDPTAPVRPEWSGRADRFWAATHATESERKDPLHRDPVYPFHVLGDAAGRFGATVGPDGALIEDSIVERMSGPWLARGWSRWREGERPEGYGYWHETDRPSWEPRVYQTMAAALTLLAWPCLDDAQVSSSTEGGTYDVTPAGRFLGRVSRVVDALSPRAAGRFDWEASPVFRVERLATSNGRIAVVGDTGEQAVPSDRNVGYRAWRYVRRDERTGRLEQDEVQVLVEHRDGRSLRLWVKVGYRPYPG